MTSIYEVVSINDNYHYGTLGGFRVIIRTDDDWINITKLCDSAGIKHKEFDQCKRQEGHKEMLKYYSKLYEPLSEDEEDEEDEERGSDQTPVQKEYYCLDIVSDKQLKGIPKKQSNIIKGSYVPKELALKITFIAMAISVLSYVVGVYLRKLPVKVVKA